jgi:pimeloyl-ACP methyl ester carboxylesterase
MLSYTMQNEIISRVASGCDTTQLAYTKWGTGSRSVVLIHGLGENRFVWDAFVSHACRDLAGLSLDLRGHGDSPWDPLQRYATHALAADVLRLSERLDLRAIVLVGHSLGAEVATRVAAACPDRVSALALVDGGPDLEQRAAALMGKEMHATPRQYDAATAYEAVLAARYPLAEPTTLRLYARRSLRPSQDRRLEIKTDPSFLSGMQSLEAASYWADLATLACPILLVRGQLSSVLTHRNASEWPRRLRNCRYAQVAAAGHAVPLENPRGLYDALTSWLIHVTRS